MSFDPDAYLANKQTSSSGFDPDAYLSSRMIANPIVPQPGQQKTKYQKPVEMSFGDNLLRGVQDIAELPRTIAEVPLSLVSGMFSPVLGAGYDLVRQITGQNEGSPFGSPQSSQRVADVAQRYTYEPRTRIGQGAVNAVNGVLSAVAPAFPNLMGGEGAALASGTNALRMAAANSPKRPPISSEEALLAKKFQDMGGKVPLHALTDNPRLKAFGERLDTLPLSGSPRASNKAVINRELLKQIGGDTTNELLTPSSFAPAMEKSGKKIGALYNKTEVPLKDINIATLREDAKLHTADVDRVINGYLDRLEVMGGDRGVVPGSALRELDTRIGDSIRGNRNSDYVSALRDLQESIRDGLNKNLSEIDRPILREERTKYAKGMFLEPIVARNNFEGVLPSDLFAQQMSTSSGRHRVARQTAGDMGDLATIGGKFLKDRNPIQTTGSFWGGIGNALSSIEGMTIGNAYNRLGPRIVANKVARSLNEREVKGYSKTPPPEPPQTGLEPFVNEGTYQARWEPRPYEPNWVFGRNNDPDVRFNPPNRPALEEPSFDRTIRNIRQQDEQRLVADRAAAAREEAWQADQERFYRQPAGRGVLLDIDPVTGRLKPTSEGLRGATPDVIASNQSVLKSAADKLSSGRGFDMTLSEKINWNNTKFPVLEATTDIKRLFPEYKALSDSAIRSKIMDRQWVADTIVKAREKAAGFDEIARRATDADKIRAATQSREKMIDLAEMLDDQLREGRPVLSEVQGKKTREAIRSGILRNPDNKGILSER